MGIPFLQIKNVTKYFAKVIANKNVSFDVGEGEVVALLGENGAGKSTIMKILYGLYQADEGDILMNGSVKKIDSPKDAMALGISMIQQHFSLVPAHTVTENIILGNIQGRIDWNEKEKQVAELAKKYHFDIDPKALIRDLPIGLQQKVEILKALYLNTKILIMDEPTAVLIPQEIDTLINFINEFKARGNAVIFITHKLKEVMSVADRIVVMKNGKVTGDISSATTNEVDLSRLMVGREIEHVKKQKTQISQKTRLKVENVSVVDTDKISRLSDVSFSVSEGEILGIAGVTGNGQQDLCEAIIGANEASGKVYLDEEDISGLSIKERIEKGIGYLPADRHGQGMVMEMSLTENMMLKDSFSKMWVKNGFIDYKALRNYTMDKIKEYDVKATDSEVLAKGLSGGNQQKVVVAREVDSGKKVIIFNQPTRGLDLGAINYVHKTILRESQKGKSIILISTELPELFTLSDKIGIMYKGELQGIFKTSELSIEKAGLLMAGYKGEVRQ